MATPIHQLRFLLEDAVKNYLLTVADPGIGVYMMAEQVAKGEEVARPYIAILAASAVPTVPDANYYLSAATNKTIELSLSIYTQADDVYDAVTGQATMTGRDYHRLLCGTICDCFHDPAIVQNLNNQGIDGLQVQDCYFQREQSTVEGAGYGTEYVWSLNCVAIQGTAGGL